MAMMVIPERSVHPLVWNKVVVPFIACVSGGQEMNELPVRHGLRPWVFLTYLANVPRIPCPVKLPDRRASNMSFYDYHGQASDFLQSCGNFHDGLDLHSHERQDDALESSAHGHLCFPRR